MKPILGYWNIRGLASPIRLLLSQANVEFDERHYDCGPPPDYDHTAYLQDKTGALKAQLQFPNLPYYLDNQVKLTQSQVILRHLARKHNLAGQSEQDRLRADLVASQVYEWAVEYGRGFAWDRRYKNKLVGYLKTLNERLCLLSDQMGEKRFVAGDLGGPTYADFIQYEYLESLVDFQPDLLAHHPRLISFVKRVDELEGVHRYFSSPTAIKRPFNGAPAVIGGPYSHLIPLKA